MLCVLLCVCVVISCSGSLKFVLQQSILLKSQFPGKQQIIGQISLLKGKVFNLSKGVLLCVLGHAFPGQTGTYHSGCWSSIRGETPALCHSSPDHIHVNEPVLTALYVSIPGMQQFSQTFHSPHVPLKLLAQLMFVPVIVADLGTCDAKQLLLIGFDKCCVHRTLPTELTWKQVR